MNSKAIESCYQCPFMEDRRDYFCNKLNKFIDGIGDGFPKDCPLDGGRRIVEHETHVKFVPVNKKERNSK